jgi:hypothetical protein
MRILIAVLAAFPIIASAAPVNKCVSADGKILFTQGACPSGHAGEEVKIRPANGMNSVANERRGPSADKYVKPLDLSGDIRQQVRKIKAVVDIGRIKARECDWDLKVSKDPMKCMDLLAYMIEGSIYSQAMERAASFTPDEIAQAKPELQSILRAVEDILEAKELALTYANTP